MVSCMTRHKSCLATYHCYDGNVIIYLSFQFYANSGISLDSCDSLARRLLILLIDGAKSFLPCKLRLND